MKSSDKFAVTALNGSLFQYHVNLLTIMSNKVAGLAAKRHDGEGKGQIKGLTI